MSLNDGELLVQLKADISGLRTALNEATSLLKGMSQGMSDLVSSVDKGSSNINAGFSSISTGISSLSKTFNDVGQVIWGEMNEVCNAVKSVEKATATASAVNSKNMNDIGKEIKNMANSATTDLNRVVQAIEKIGGTGAGSLGAKLRTLSGNMTSFNNNNVEGLQKILVAVTQQTYKLDQAMQVLGKDMQKCFADGLKAMQDMSRGMNEATANSNTFLGSLKQLAINLFIITESAKHIGHIFGNLIEPGIHFARQMEVAELGIAGIVMSMGQIEGKTIAYNSALNISATLMRDMQKASVVTAMTTDQLIKTFQGIVGPALSAGLSLKEVERVAIVGANAVRKLGMDSSLAVSEIRALFSGHGQAMFPKMLGYNQATLNNLKETGKLYEDLMKRLQGFETTSKDFGNTFEGLLSNLKDGIQIVSGEGLSPIFQKLKDEIREISSLFYTVKDVASDIKQEGADFGKEVQYNNGFIGVLLTISANIVNVWNRLKEAAIEIYAVVESHLKDAFEGISRLGNTILINMKLIGEVLLTWMMAKSFYGTMLGILVATDTLKPILKFIADHIELIGYSMIAWNLGVGLVFRGFTSLLAMIATANVASLIGTWTNAMSNFNLVLSIVSGAWARMGVIAVGAMGLAMEGLTTLIGALIIFATSTLITVGNAITYCFATVSTMSFSTMMAGIVTLGESILTLLGPIGLVMGAVIALGYALDHVMDKDYKRRAEQSNDIVGGTSFGGEEQGEPPIKVKPYQGLGDLRESERTHKSTQEIIDEAFAKQKEFEERARKGMEDMAKVKAANELPHKAAKGSGTGKANAADKADEKKVDTEADEKAREAIANLREAIKELEEQYQTGKLGMEAYYDGMAKAEKKVAEATYEALVTKRDEANKLKDLALARGDSTQATRHEADALKYEGEMKVNSAKLTGTLIDLTRKHERDIKSLTKELVATNIEYEKYLGHLAKAAELQTHQKYDDARKKYQSDAEAISKVLKDGTKMDEKTHEIVPLTDNDVKVLQERLNKINQSLIETYAIQNSEVAMGHYQELKQKYEDLSKEAANMDAHMKAGNVPTQDRKKALDGIHDSMNKLIPQIKTWAELIGGETGHRAVLEAQSLIPILTEEEEKYREIAKTIKDDMTNSLSDFFEKNMWQCRNLKDAFKALFKSVLEDINKIIAKDVAGKIMKLPVFSNMSKGLSDFASHTTGVNEPTKKAGGISQGFINSLMPNKDFLGSKTPKSNQFNLDQFKDLSKATKDSANTLKKFDLTSKEATTATKGAKVMTEGMTTAEQVAKAEEVKGTAIKTTENQVDTDLSVKLALLAKGMDLLSTSIAEALIKIKAAGFANGGMVKHFSNGGNVWGAGTSTSDSIPAMLSDGEFVIKADSVKKYGHNYLQALNAGRLPALKYANGGMVNGASQAQSTNNNNSNISVNFNPVFQSLDPAQNAKAFEKQFPVFKQKMLEAINNEPSTRGVIRKANT